MATRTQYIYAAVAGIVFLVLFNLTLDQSLTSAVGESDGTPGDSSAAAHTGAHGHAGEPTHVDVPVVEEHAPPAHVPKGEKTTGHAHDKKPTKGEAVSAASDVEEAGMEELREREQAAAERAAAAEAEAREEKKRAEEEAARKKAEQEALRPVSDVTPGGFKFVARKVVATSSFAPDDITIVSQCSVDRVPVLAACTRVWQGPMSVSIYLHEGKEDEELAQLDELIKNEPLLSTYVDFHVLYEGGTSYPVNPLRNVALKYARTDTVFLVDADFVTESSMEHYKKTYLQLKQSNTITEHHVLVVAAFSSWTPAQYLPRNKEALIDAINNGHVEPVNLCACGGCHGPTDYDRWYHDDEPHEVAYDWFYEPYILGPRSMPEYSELFVGYANDKTEHIWELAARGFKFMLMGREFIVHLNHVEAKWKKAEHSEGKSYTESEIHQVACKFIADKRDELAETGVEDVLLSPSANACWQGRCYGDLRVIVEMPSNREIMVAFYQSMSFDRVLNLLHRRVGDFTKLEYYELDGSLHPLATKDDLRIIAATTMTQQQLAYPDGERGPLHKINTLRFKALFDTPPPTGRGHALTFDGLGTYVEMQHPIRHVDANAVTIEWWQLAESLNNFRSRHHSMGVLSIGWLFQVRVDCWGALEVVWAVSEGEMMRRRVCRQTITEGKWQHVAVTVDARHVGVFKLYVDGRIILRESIPNLVEVHIAEWNKLRLGVDAAADSPFLGILDDVRIWRSIRSKEQLVGSAKTRFVGNEENLVGLWKLDEGEGSETRDATANGNHGMLRGMPENRYVYPKWTTHTAPT